MRGIWVPADEKYRGGQSYAEYDGERPGAASYMPQWPEGVATCYQQYETVTEGTPISPVFATARLMAEWLVQRYGDDFTVEERLADILEQERRLLPVSQN
jgi:hypothetical protein